MPATLGRRKAGLGVKMLKGGGGRGGDTPPPKNYPKGRKYIKRN